MTEQLAEVLKETKNLVFFGGAGVSTESGIPDFRSADGLYHTKYAYPPEEIVSHSFFMRDTDEFYRFYRDKMIWNEAKPNPAHIALAKLEKAGKLKAIVTQNIDGLHQAAGSEKVLELHGSVHRNYCMNCGKFYDLDAILQMPNVPHCTCGGIIKPDVVLYEESLDENVLEESLRAISEAEVLIIGGTSLAVYPAASLVRYFNGKHLVLINKSETPMDRTADILIHAPIGEVLSECMERMEK